MLIKHLSHIACKIENREGQAVSLAEKYVVDLVFHRVAEILKWSPTRLCVHVSFLLFILFEHILAAHSTCDVNVHLQPLVKPHEEECLNDKK